GFELHFRHIDVPLLEEQEAFFANTQSYLYCLEYHLSVLQGKPIYPQPLVPTEQAHPPLHNPESQHVPPWLNEDQQAQHLARALAEERGVPRQTPAQIALEEARAAKKALKATNDQKARDGEARTKSRSDLDSNPE